MSPCLGVGMSILLFGFIQVYTYLNSASEYRRQSEQNTLMLLRMQGQLSVDMDKYARDVRNASEVHRSAIICMWQHTDLYLI